MEEVEMKSAQKTNSNLIQIDLLNSVDTQATFTSKNNRERRIKKQKLIHDLGYEPCGEHKRAPVKLKTHKSSKTQTISKIFDQFKLSPHYSHFPQFKKIEKALKSQSYTSHVNLANDIRRIFNDYFTSFSNDPREYNKTFELCRYFEDIYNEYDEKIFAKESKNLIEIKKKLNRLKKDIREKNISKFKINVNDYNNLSFGERKASQKYKVNLANNIRSLNSDQIKGIIAIISDSFSVDNKIVEIDVNKLPSYKLKELDKYVKKCLRASKGKSEGEDKRSSNSSNSVSGNPHLKGGENINVNININNNFMMREFSSKNDEQNKDTNFNMVTHNSKSLFSDSDSLSSDDEDSDSISSLSE